MFFSLSKTKDPRFPNHQAVGSWILSHDEGWRFKQTAKGYSWAKGFGLNRASVYYENNDVVLEHNRYRSFPLWWDDKNQVLTNLLGTGESIWADTQVRLTNRGLEKTYVDVIGEIDNSKLALDDVVSMIDSRMSAKFKHFKDTTNQPKLFLTGGIDTLLLLAFCKAHDIDYSYVNCEHFDYDRFTNANFEEIKRTHWGYRQMHHWVEPSCLISGCPGDEFFLRGPAAIAIWCAWHDIDFVEYLKTAEPGYHTGYFLKDENAQLFIKAYQNRAQLKKDYQTENDLNRQILNMLVNDHQHWHLGNTLTWTPYLDLEIPKLILRLSKEDLLEHFVNATINKELIKHLDSDLLGMLSTTKNANTRVKLVEYGY